MRTERSTRETLRPQCWSGIDMKVRREERPRRAPEELYQITGQEPYSSPIREPNTKHEESQYTNLSRVAGDSVQLDTRDPVPEFTSFTWLFNRADNVVEYLKEFKRIKPYSGYKGRVEFNEGNYSLTLKNLQTNDSGLYEARVSGDQVTVVAEYSLSVSDANNPQNPGSSVLGIVVAVVVVIAVVVLILIYRRWRRSAGLRGLDGGTVLSQKPQSSKQSISEEPDHGATHTEDTVYAEIEHTGVAASQTEKEPTSTVYSAVQKNRKPPGNGQSSQTTPAPEDKHNSVLWGSVLWGSVLWGSVLWGSVLWAASCGQRPVLTDEGLEDDQHCTVQQQMSYRL
ncbi:hypothetical protein NFI96_015740 [Prochilodus magdalenae]|nr:hypothetical protein NFI96_015740 [Prochilodus magdalenae]